MSYVGVPPFGQTLVTDTEVIATQGQVDFYPNGGYIPGYMTVHIDGAELQSYDFIANDGKKVTVKVACGAGDDVKLTAQWPVSLIDTFRKSEIWAAIGDMTSSVGFRNRLNNGDMRIDQRNAGASITPVTGQTNYPVDRWTVDVSQASKLTAQRNAGSVTPPVGFTNYLGITSSSAYAVASSDYFLLNQRVEGLNIADLAWGTSSAQSVTLSFRVYSSLIGTFGGAIRNSASNRSYPFTYTVNGANTWTTVSITIPGDTTGAWATDNTLGLYVYFGLGVGATFSGPAGAWAGTNYVSATGAQSVVGTNGATFYITGVQLEAGTVATPFERRSYQQELAMCQRYYFKDLSASAGQGFCSGQVYSSTIAQVIYKYPTTMRAAPSCSVYNVKVQSGPTATASTSAITNARVGLNSTQMDITVSGFTAGYALWLQDDGSNTGYVSGSAEL